MTVKKRAVCYISGFDPRGVRHYYNLFKKELQAYTDLTGVAYEVGKRSKGSNFTYTWQCKPSGDSDTSLDYFFLSHEDVIKKHWIKTQNGLFWETWRCYLAMARTRMFRKILKKYRPAIYSTSYPFVFGLLTLAIALVVFFALGLFLPFAPWIAWSVASILGVAALWMGKLIDNKFNHYWLMRTIAYILLCKYRQQPDFDTLLQRMSDQISKLDKKNEYDEILVIGHSYGAVLGVEVMAQLLGSDPEVGKRKASVSFISLAGIIGLAHANDVDPGFKNSVFQLGTQTQIDWIDLGARADGASTSMLDPFYAADIEVSSPHYPRLFPVRFFKCFSDEGYKNLKTNKFEFHFQYLKTSEFLGEYDFYKMLLGEQGIESLYPRTEEHPPSAKV